MRACLDVAMTRQRQGSRLGLSCGGDPARDTTDLDHVDHRQITGFGSDGVGHSAREPPVLAGLDRNRANSLTNDAMAVQVLGADRFFNPGQIKSLSRRIKSMALAVVCDWLRSTINLHSGPIVLRTAATVAT